MWEVRLQAQTQVSYMNNNQYHTNNLSLFVVELQRFHYFVNSLICSAIYISSKLLSRAENVLIKLQVS